MIALIVEIYKGCVMLRNIMKNHLSVSTQNSVLIDYIFSTKSWNMNFLINVGVTFLNNYTMCLHVISSKFQIMD